MNTIMSNLRTLAYVLVSAFALSVSTVNVANAQCKHYVYNPLLPTAQGTGGMDCVSISMAAGTDGVTGASLLTTANRVPVVNGAGELTQSDVSLSSGIFSRAGTVGLSATGANAVTIATNGTTKAMVSSDGSLTVQNLGATNDVLATRLSLNSGADGALGALNYAVNMFPSATGSSRYVSIQVGDTSNYRRLVLQPAGGNLLVGTTTDDGSSKAIIQSTVGTSAASFSDGVNYTVAIKRSGATGNVGLVTGTVSSALALGANNVEYARLVTSGNFLIGTATDGNYRLDVGSSGSTGTARFYDQTATTGVTSLVVRAGAGQSTNALQTWAVNSGTSYSGVNYLATLYSSQISSNGLAASSTYIISSGAWDARGFKMASDYVQGWSNATVNINTIDIGLARNAAGIIEVNNGSAGMYRDIIARSPIWTATAAATLANSQCTVHLASDTQLTFTCKGSDGTNRTNTLTLAP